MEFVMSMSTSNITPTFQIDPEQQLRIKARYNATERHTGGSRCQNWPPEYSNPYTVLRLLILSSMQSVVCML